MPASSRSIKILMPVLSVAIIGAFSLAAWSFYSSHQQACASRGETLDVVRDVVVIAMTPAPGETRTAEEEAGVQKFEGRVFARINQARC